MKTELPSASGRGAAGSAHQRASLVNPVHPFTDRVSKR